MEEIIKELEKREDYLGATLTETGMIVVLKDKQVNVSKEDIERIEEVLPPVK